MYYVTTNVDKVQSPGELKGGKKDEKDPAVPEKAHPCRQGHGTRPAKAPRALLS